MLPVLKALSGDGSGSYGSRCRYIAIGFLMAVAVFATGLLVPGQVRAQSEGSRGRAQADEREAQTRTEDSRERSQDEERTPRKRLLRTERRALDEDEERAAASRDSLLQEIKSYSRIISALRDSLNLADIDLELSADQRLEVEQSIQQFTEVIKEIGQELSRLDLEIADNTVSLLDESGEGIVINIPEDLEDRVREGFQTLSRVILAELPDTLHFEQEAIWDWTGFVPDAPPPPRKVLHGNMIKVWDDLVVSTDEDVRGDVVVVLGNSALSGRVEGNVVVVFGDLRLEDSAEITGQVVTVGGRLDKADQAEVSGGVVVVDPLRWRGGRWMPGAMDQSRLAFLVSQGGFVLMLMLAVLVVGIAPQTRLQVVLTTLRQQPVPTLGVGFVSALVGHLVFMILMGILVLTVIGIPLALIVALALALLGVGATGITAAVIGQRICRAVSGKCASPWIAVALGMAALHLLSFSGGMVGLTPSLGGLSGTLSILGVVVKALAYLFGLGALVWSRWGSRKEVLATP